MENAKPSLEVKSRRIGGATYQVPIEIPPNRRISMAMRWIINHSRAKAGRSMEDGLSSEFADCFNNQGQQSRKKMIPTGWPKLIKHSPIISGKRR